MRSAFVVLALSVVGGCSSNETIPTRHPVTGTVRKAGQPVAGGGLIFLPVGRSSGLVLNAHVNPDGTFSAETTRNRPNGGVDSFPGLAVGEYKAVYHPPSDGQRTGLEVELGTVTVPPGGIDVTLSLPDKMPSGNGADRDDDPKSPIYNPKRD